MIKLKLFFYKIFNKVKYVELKDEQTKITALKLVYKNFRGAPEKHLQQLFVESCRILNVKQNDSSKALIYQLVSNENPGYKYFASKIPVPRLNIKAFRKLTYT